VTAAPGSYSQALAQAKKLINAGKLADPGEHFPYKHKHISGLIAQDPPAGPRGPDDRTLSLTDYIDQDVADAAAEYIAAQAAYLAKPTAANRRRYHITRDLLIMARRAHRRGQGRA
jgi:hypothetical protein